MWLSTVPEILDGAVVRWLFFFDARALLGLGCVRCLGGVAGEVDACVFVFFKICLEFWERKGRRGSGRPGRGKGSGLFLKWGFYGWRDEESLTAIVNNDEDRVDLFSCYILHVFLCSYCL